MLFLTSNLENGPHSGLARRQPRAPALNKRTHFLVIRLRKLCSAICDAQHLVQISEYNIVNSDIFFSAI